uniref:Uncharacterized protein n=1 Tax=Candidatus Kentrum sp. LFY TaxID=2126342 RepID=A0A450WXK4_9GAMM|nr:MAG: hypothetical protein BECKLFY1418C_GA0070996_110211 [Candidatus Kentron sp. LFY]
MLDHERIRREGMRWNILLTLGHARPSGCWEELVLDTVQAIHPDTTRLELHRELDHVADLGLIEIEKKPYGRWYAKLNARGTNVVDYTADCPPGIARPTKKYW